jgi:hypothetical protein
LLAWSRSEITGGGIEITGSGGSFGIVKYTVMDMSEKGYLLILVLPTHTEFRRKCFECHNYVRNDRTIVVTETQMSLKSLYMSDRRLRSTVERDSTIDAIFVIESALKNVKMSLASFGLRNWTTFESMGVAYISSVQRYRLIELNFLIHSNPEFGQRRKTCFSRRRRGWKDIFTAAIYISRQFSSLTV